MKRLKQSFIQMCNRQNWRSAFVIQQQQSLTAIYNIGLYIILFFGYLSACLILQNNVKSAEINHVFVSSLPLFLPLLLCVAIVSMYLAVLASIQVSRERDKGTLEVLFFGPVNESAYLWGIFLAYVKIFLGAILLVFIWALAASWILHLAFSYKLILMLLSSILMASGLISFGNLTGVLGKKTRSALVYFFLAILILGSIQIGDQIMGIFIQSAATVTNSILFIRNALAFLSNAIQWISPFSQMTILMDALADDAYLHYVLHLIVLCVQILILQCSAIFVLRRKGVRG